MKEQEHVNYNRIATAIDYIKQNLKTYGTLALQKIPVCSIYIIMTGVDVFFLYLPVSDT